jgi:hypothetical protein
MIFEPGRKKKLFLDIFSTNIDTILFESLPYLHFNLFVISETFATKLEPLYATNTSRRKYVFVLFDPFGHRRSTKRRLLFGSTILKHGHYSYYRN